MSEPMLVSIYKDVYGVMFFRPQKTSFFHHIRWSHLWKNIDGWELLDPHTLPYARPTQTRVPAEIFEMQDWTQQQEPHCSMMLHIHQGKEPQFMTVLWLLRKLLNVRSIITVLRERPVQFLPLKSTSKPKPPDLTGIIVNHRLAPT